MWPRWGCILNVCGRSSAALSARDTACSVTVVTYPAWNANHGEMTLNSTTSECCDGKRDFDSKIRHLFCYPSSCAIVFRRRSATWLQYSCLLASSGMYCNCACSKKQNWAAEMRDAAWQTRRQETGSVKESWMSNPRLSAADMYRPPDHGQTAEMQSPSHGVAPSLLRHVAGRRQRDTSHC
jgi:hypothetical protein